MNQRIWLLVFTWLLVGTSCNDPTGICGTGYNLCFELDGVPKKFNATWTETSYGYVIADSQIVGLDTQKVEIAVYGNPNVAIIPLSENGPYNTEAIISYTENSENFQVRMGELYIINTAANRIAGNFNAEMFHEFQTDSIPLTNGHIDAIPHQ